MNYTTMTVDASSYEVTYVIKEACAGYAPCLGGARRKARGPRGVYALPAPARFVHIYLTDKRPVRLGGCPSAGGTVVVGGRYVCHIKNISDPETFYGFTRCACGQPAMIDDTACPTCIDGMQQGLLRSLEDYEIPECDDCGCPGYRTGHASCPAGGNREEWVYEGEQEPPFTPLVHLCEWCGRPGSHLDEDGLYRCE